MLYRQERTTSLFYYRLFFVALLLLIGIAGTGTLALEYYTDIKIISAETARDTQAITATAGVMGTFSLLTGFLMLYLMREKRGASSDRRQRSEALDFSDRRSSADRRDI